MKCPTVSKTCMFRGAVLLVLTAISGCAAAGFVAHVAEGTQPIKAAYKLSNRPTIVLVENYRNPAAAALDAQPMAMLISESIGAQKVATMLDPDLLRVALKQRNSTIASLGRDAGAAQLIYVDLRELQVNTESGGDVFRGKASAMVRVIDCRSGATLWPLDSAAGTPINVETPVLRKDQNMSHELAATTLAQALAERIAILFYDRKPE